MDNRKVLNEFSESSNISNNLFNEERWNTKKTAQDSHVVLTSVEMNMDKAISVHDNNVRRRNTLKPLNEDWPISTVADAKVFELEGQGHKNVTEEAARLFIQKQSLKEKLHQCRSEWRLLAKMMDRLFFVLFLAAIVIVTVTIFTVAKLYCRTYDHF